MKYLPIILTIGTIILLIRVFRKPIIKYLLHLRGKLTVAGIRHAIKEADADKAKTSRKNMVVLNTSSGAWEPVQKRQLKAVARVNRNKNNAKMTEGRKWFMSKSKQKRKSSITTEKVRQLETKSVYVTN